MSGKFVQTIQHIGSLVLMFAMLAANAVPTSAASSDASLTALSVSPGTLSPAFSSTTFAYTVTEASTGNPIHVSATAASGATYTVTVNGATLYPVTDAIYLINGSNLIAIAVTAEDGSTKNTYTIDVSWVSGPGNDATLSGLSIAPAKLDLPFDSSTFGYTSGIPESTSQITVSATPTNSSATVQMTLDSDTPVTENPHLFTLSSGPHILQIKVTTTSNNLTYSVDIHRTTLPATTLVLASGLNPSTQGDSVTFTATLTSGSTPIPAATITFSDGATSLGTGTTDSSGVATLSTSGITAGHHNLTASFAGDASFQGSTSNTVDQNVRAATSLTLTSSSGGLPSAYGGSLTFTASITPTDATGTVTFRDNGVDIGVCTGQSLITAQATCMISTLSIGIHPITAVYGGNGTYAASTSSTLNQEVSLAATSLTLVRTAGASPSTYGDSLTFTATLTGPGSSPLAGLPVTIKEGTETLLSANTDSSGQVSLATSSLTAGSHPLTAAFAGDASYTLSSANLTQEVGKATPTVTVNTSPASTVNQAYTVTVNVTPTYGTPTGTVSVTDGTSSCAPDISLPVTTCSLTSNSAGTKTITATYSGDGNFNGASGTASHEVTLTSTTVALSSSGNPSYYGGAVTFTASITPAATGTVSFKDGAAAITGCSAQVITGGQATCATSGLSLGSHDITAVYSGDPAYAGSTSSILFQVVNKTPTTTTLTRTVGSVTSIYGSSLTFTAAVSPVVAGGTVDFLDGSNPITGCSAVLLTSGAAECSTSALTPGSHSITAVYGGDTTHEGSTSNSVSQQVEKIATTTSVARTSGSEPSPYGSSLTFTAAVSGGGSGTVNFQSDGADIGGCTGMELLSGSAVCIMTDLTVGTHAITAVYGGDPTHATSTSAGVNQTVNKATSSVGLGSSPNPSSYGAAITFTATVSPATASGTVAFLEGSTPIGDCGAVVVSGGTAACPLSSLSAGSHAITAVYSGDGNYQGSGSTAVDQVVQKATTSLTLALTSGANPSTYGDSVTFTATLTSGAVNLSGAEIIFGIDETNQPAVTSNASGQAVLTTSALGGGSHTIAVSFAGDGNYALSSANLTQVVNKADPTVAVNTSPTSTNVGVPYTVTVGVSSTRGTPGGTVTVSDGTDSCASPIALPASSCTLTSTTAGAKTITATYGGDANFNTASGSAAHPVALNPTTITLSSSPNDRPYGTLITFIATVSPAAAAGTVAFLDDSAVITGCEAITLDATGVAACTTSSLPASTSVHSITAEYSGNTTYAGSGSAPVSQKVNKANPTLLLETSGSPITVGNPVTFTVTISPLAATGKVNFNDGANGLVSCINITLDGLGKATCTTSTLAVGAHAITANYMPDGTNYDFARSNQIDQVVNAISTTTTLSLTAGTSTSEYGSSLTFTAAVSPAGTGTAAFLDGSSPITSCEAVTVASGLAACTTSALAVGTHAITAIYSGDTTHATSTSTAVNQTVNQAPSTVSLVSTPNPSTYGALVTFTATVSPAGASGTVAFMEGSNPIGDCGTVSVSSGTASCTISSLPAGSHAITAAYSGDISYLSSSTTTALSQTVNQATTTLTLARTAGVSPSTYGDSLTFTTTLTSGTVNIGGVEIVFGVDGIDMPAVTTNASGQAALTTSTLGGGSHSITASFAGNANYQSSSKFIYQTVNPAATGLTLGRTAGVTPSIYGASLTFTATLTGPGSAALADLPVTIKDGSATLLSTNTDSLGKVSLTTNMLVVGSHPLTASFGGNANYTLSSANLTQVVGKATPTVTVSTSPASSTVNSPYSVTVGVSFGVGTPTGNVTVSDGTDSCASPITLPATTCVLTSTTAGSKTITAVYSGDSNFNTASGTASHGVNPVFSISGQAIYNGTGMAGVTITYFSSSFQPGDPDYRSGSIPADGNGSYQISNLPAGNYSLHAAKPGYSFAPDPLNTIISYANLTGQNFTATHVANNNPTIWSTYVVNATAGVEYLYLVQASDPDGDPLLFDDPTLIDSKPLPSWLTFTHNPDHTLTLSGTPTMGDLGQVYILLTVRDGVGGVGTQQFILTVSSPYSMFMPLVANQ